MKNNELNNVNQRIRDVRKYTETNPFDFTDVSKDNDINLTQFPNIAEKNVILYENEPILNIIVDAVNEKYPILLRGEIKITGGENSKDNRFYRDVEQLTKAIEKMTDKYGETLEVLFTGEMNKNTLIFNKEKRFDFGTRCNVFLKKNWTQRRVLLYTSRKRMLQKISLVYL